MTPEHLERAWEAGWIVPLAAAAEWGQLERALGVRGAPGSQGPFGAEPVLEPLGRQWGPGVLVGSGGSSGGRRWCLQPLAHLQASAAATGQWLADRGLDPASCLHLNPLPLHHVSGLLPLVRSRQWGCAHQPLPPALMRDPLALAAAVSLPVDRSALISLVPTQLRRLMAVAEGRAWLQRLAVIWVGGAALPPELAAQAREQGLRLAPCYGATETAAMVTALAPEAFLAGAQGCGQPLADVQLRIEPVGGAAAGGALAGGAIAVQTRRLSPGWLEDGQLRPLPGCDGSRTTDGWWRSGDGGELTADGLRILGRLDGAISSGGETVFPEQLEARLIAMAEARSLPLEALLLLGESDLEWGQRLVALVRAQAGASAESLIPALQHAVASWPPAERPRRWLSCDTLAPTATGKWQRGHWQAWVQSLEAG